MNKIPIHALLAASFAMTAAMTAAHGWDEQFDWKRFEVAGRPAFVIMPAKENRRDPIPWVMYAPTFDRSLPQEAAEGWMFEHFLAAGIAIAGVDVGESFGSPAGRATYDALYMHLTSSDPKFAPKAGLLARSRGGLMLYNWAAENPDKVACIAGIYPVCDLRSYPGLARACGAYGLAEAQLAASLNKHNPVARLEPLAAAKIPIFHIHGDVDKVVPLRENSGAVAATYRKLDGVMELVVPPGQGHNMWSGFFHSHGLVEFVIAHALGGPSPISPIARWRLDEPEGAIANDTIGGHHGRIVGTKPALGKQSGARLFNRMEGDHIEVDYSKDFDLSTFTVAAWVKLTRPPTFSGILGTRFGGVCTFDMKVNDAKVHGDIGDGKQWLQTKVNFYEEDRGTNGQGGKLSLNRWYHVVYVIDGANQECRLYLDADLKKTVRFEGTPRLMQPGQQLRIGNSSSDEFMDGVIDEVCIWDKALPTDQISRLFQAPIADK